MIDSRRSEEGTDDKSYHDRQLERVSKVNEQPWGRFLGGIAIRVIVVFAVAATLITVIQLLRG